MAKIAFISHASEDAAIAATITEYLEANGVSCWIAPRDVTPGQDYASEIVGGIESSAVFVLVLSENANDSIYVKREVERAVSKGRPIFPIRVREVMPSRSLELFISSAHWIDAWKPPLEKYLERLAQSISTAAALYPAAAASVPIPGRSSRSTSLSSNRRFLALSIAILALLVVGGAGWYVQKLLGTSEPTLSTVEPEPRSDSDASDVPQAAPAAPRAEPAAPAPARTALQEVVAPRSSSDAPEPCPGSLSINRDLPTPFTCTCSGEAARSNSGTVWGTGVYTDDSLLCRAALHAGAIGSEGGTVTVVRSEGRPLYAGSSRNGVTSYDYGNHQASIAFEGTAAPAAGPVPCPGSLSINRDLPTPFTCTCSGEAARSNSGTVWGTDVYTDDSLLCRAAVHAGAIGSEGGTVTVVRSEGRPLYAGTSRNGVTSYDYGNHQASIAFEGTAAPEAGPVPCPGSLSINRDLPTPFTCTCSSEAARSNSGTVWGTDVYTDDSLLCRAAVHAGAIGSEGGTVTVVRSEGRPLYAGSSRNGVTSYDYGNHQASIAFDGTAAPEAGLEPCPGSLSINRDLPTPFTCDCSGEAARSNSGTVWGTDVYTDDSLLCRAAVHAGAIGSEGGTVTVVRSEGRAIYAGSSRNGVTSYDYGSFEQSIRFQ